MDIFFTIVSSFYNLRNFYFTVHSLKVAAVNKGVEVCFPSFVEKPGFYAINAYDISLFKNVEIIVPNDADLLSHRVQFVLGANGGGKTTYLRAVGINLILALSGCFVFCKELKLYKYNRIYTHYPTNEKLDAGGRFIEEIRRLDKILSNTNVDTFALLNECLSSTISQKGISFAMHY